MNRLSRKIATMALAASMAFPVTSAIANADGLSGHDGSTHSQNSSLPVQMASPTTGATNIKPTASLQFQFNLNSKAFHHIRKVFKLDRDQQPTGTSSDLHPESPKAQVRVAQHAAQKAAHEQAHEHPRIGVLITGPNGSTLYTMDHGLSYNASTAVLTFTHQTAWSRYTPYQVQVLVNAALNQYLGHQRSDGHSHANHYPPQDVYSTSFTTGSAIGEPVVWHLGANPSPSVVTGDAVTVSAQDSYGDPATSGSAQLSVSPSTGQALAISPNPVSIQNGQGTTTITDHTAQTVTITAQTTGPYTQDTKTLTAQSAFQPGPLAQVRLNPVSAVVLPGQSVMLSGTATDIYGNVEPAGTEVTLTASSGSISTGTASGSTGGFQVTYTNTNGTSGFVAITGPSGETVTDSGVSIVAAQPTPGGATVELSAPVQNANGTYTITGTLVGANGQPLAYTAISGSATGGSLQELGSGGIITTNSSGQFTLTYTPPAGGGNGSVAVYPVSNSGSVNTTAPLASTGIDPLIYGNQAWTDTGITVQAGQEVKVASTGSWANQLYAKVGNGPAVLVGANGTFVAGQSGTLYLGTNGTAQTGNVESTIYVNSLTGIVPTMDLTVGQTNLPADGTFTDTVNGQLMMGQVPVVGATVDLSLSPADGSLASTSVATNGQGQFTDTYTAGSAAGTVDITATSGSLHQSASITLTTPSASNASPASGGWQVLSGSWQGWTATATGSVAVVQDVYANTITAQFQTSSNHATSSIGSSGDAGVIFAQPNGTSFGVALAPIYQVDSHFVIYSISTSNSYSPVVWDGYMVPYAPNSTYTLSATLKNGVLTATVTGSSGKSSTLSIQVPNGTYYPGVYGDAGITFKSFIVNGTQVTGNP